MADSERTSEASEMRKFWEPAASTIAEAALLAVGLICLIVGAHRLATITDGLAGVTALGAGLVLLFAATIGRFELLKGLGIEAKTRAVDAKIAEVERIEKRVRRLAEVSGRAIVNLDSSVGRFDSTPTVSAAHGRVIEVRMLLRDIGSTPQTLKDVTQPWTETVAFDLAQSLRNSWRKEAFRRLAALRIGHEKVPGEAEGENTLGMTLAGKFEEAVNKAAAVTYAPSEGAGAALPFLREVARAMSGVDEEFDQMVRKALEEWAPELRHLVDTRSC